MEKTITKTDKEDLISDIKEYCINTLINNWLYDKNQLAEELSEEYGINIDIGDISTSGYDVIFNIASPIKLSIKIRITHEEGGE